MAEVIKIPLSTADSYLTDTFSKERYLRSFNKGLRGVSVPVGDFHEPLHDQVIYDLDTSSRADISHMANLYSVREPRYKARVLYIEWCKESEQYVAAVEWGDLLLAAPRYLRVTAVLKSNRCIRVLQFGVE